MKHALLSRHIRLLFLHNSLLHIPRTNQRTNGLGIFQKQTSVKHVKSLSDTFVRTMVRQQDVGGTVGTFTRCYVVVLFDNEWWEKLMKFVIVSCLLQAVLPFSLHEETSFSSFLGLGLTLSLTQAALLFILPPNEGFTATERVLVYNILSSAMMMVTTHWYADEMTSFFVPALAWYVVNMIVSTLIMCHAIRGYQKLVSNVKKVLNPGGEYDIADFKALERWM